MRSLSAALLALALLPAVPAAAHERLLVPELSGWHVVSSQSDPRAEVSELVPAGETAERWSRRLTVQAFRGGPMTASDFLDGLVERTGEVCDDFQAGPIAPLPQGGRRTIACGKYHGDGRGSFTLFYALSGREALYVLARAWRGDPFRPASAPPVSPREMAEWNALFDLVRLCDTSDPARPCPPESSR